MPVHEVVESVIDLIKKNVIAKTNVVSDVLTGDILVNVENSFHFDRNEEIILIDYGYNDTESSHYNLFEYTRIKEVNNTHWITLYSPVIDTNGWLVSNRAFIQKTIGHSPLYEEGVFYGDRDVIPSDQIAITVEPTTLSNEWMYIQGGLSEEYTLDIIVYGKSVSTQEGSVILSKYADCIYELLNNHMHFDINDYHVAISEDVYSNSYSVIIADTEENRENFTPSTIVKNNKDDAIVLRYKIQDNLNVEDCLYLNSVQYTGDGYMILSVNKGRPSVVGSVPLQYGYKTSEYAVFIRKKRYIYDSRTSNITFGKVQKSSAILRAAQLTWFGKEINKYNFPQKTKKVDYFKEVDIFSSSSSSF